jgi:hypothetical protein
MRRKGRRSKWEGKRRRLGEGDGVHACEAICAALAVLLAFSSFSGFASGDCHFVVVFSFLCLIYVGVSMSYW